MSVCTVIERKTSSGRAKAVAETLKAAKIEFRESQIDGKATDFFTVEDINSEVRAQLYELADAENIDIIVQSEPHRQKKLVVFDMDSTLIQNECIDLIAARANVQPQVADITERAMRGELDFKQSLTERVNLLKGIPTTVYKDLISEITLTPGARELCATLKSHNVKLAVLSGGFQPIVDWIKGELDLDYAFANHLVSEDNKLTGKTEGEVVDGNRKAQLLKEIAEREKVELEDVVAVGDGSNDLPMMAVAGFGIAWHAKPLVQVKAPSRLNGDSLADALYIMGYKN